MATRGYENFTATDAARHALKHTRQDARIVPKPRSKYGAVKTTVDGIVFDSAKEAKRYGELKLLEKAGKIHRLTLQHRIRLLVYAAKAPKGFPMQKIGEYVADFTYCVCDTPKSCDGTGGHGVIEDVKGFKTALYRWKKKHVEMQYGIQIREI